MAAEGLCVVGGTVVTMNAAREVLRVEISVKDRFVERFGPSTAGGRAETTIIDASGCFVVPLVNETIEMRKPRRLQFQSRCLQVGNVADFAVVRRPVRETEIAHALVVRPADLEALVLDGKMVVGGARRLPERGSAALTPLRADDPRLTRWIDRTGYLHQYLGADGRYDETRAGRAHAFQGRFWFRDDTVVYLDDSGFWAFGDFHQGELHHAGYVLTPG